MKLIVCATAAELILSGGLFFLRHVCLAPSPVMYGSQGWFIIGGAIVLGRGGAGRD